MSNDQLFDRVKLLYERYKDMKSIITLFELASVVIDSMTVLHQLIDDFSGP